MLKRSSFNLSQNPFGVKVSIALQIVHFPPAIFLSVKTTQHCDVILYHSTLFNAEDVYVDFWTWRIQYILWFMAHLAT